MPGLHMHYPSLPARSEQGPSDLKIGVAFASQPSLDQASKPCFSSAPHHTVALDECPLVGRPTWQTFFAVGQLRQPRRVMAAGDAPSPTMAHQTRWEAPAAWPAWPARSTNTLSPHPRLRVPLCRAVFRPGLRQFFAHPGPCLSDRPANLHLAVKL